MISVVIPLYNRKNCILNLIEDILGQKNVENLEIVIVDDCSPDDSVEVIRQKFPEVKLLVNEKNSGPCVSRNRGINAASSEIIVGFDSDVSLTDTNLLSKVEKAFKESPDVTGFAFRLYEPNGITDDALRWWHPIPIENGKNYKFETDYFSGTAYAFRKKSMVDAGLYPEIFYMHYEEVELAWRILDNGGTIYYNPELSVIHHANPVSRRSEIKVFYKPRNQILITIRCYTLFKGLIYLTPRLLKGCFCSTVRLHLKDWWRAMFSAITLSTKYYRDRKPLKQQTWRRIYHMKKSTKFNGGSK